MGLLVSVIDELESSLAELTPIAFKALYKRPVSALTLPEYPCLELRMAGNPYLGRGTGRDQWNTSVSMVVIIYAQQTGDESHVRTLATLMETVRTQIRTHFGDLVGGGINLDSMSGEPDPDITALSADHLVGYIDVVCSGVDKF